MHEAQFLDGGKADSTKVKNWKVVKVLNKPFDIGEHKFSDKEICREIQFSDDKIQLDMVDGSRPAILNEQDSNAIAKHFESVKVYKSENFTMPKQQVKRAMELAKVLGFRVREDDNSVSVDVGDSDLPVWEKFKPEQDKALLWDLQIEHKVEISPWGDESMVVYIENPNNCERLITIDDVTKETLPAALIDCVIAVNGGSKQQTVEFMELNC